MDIVESSLHGVPLLTLVGELDHAVGMQLKEAADRVRTKSDDCLLLDLSRCPYLDSSALNVIFGLVFGVGATGWVGVIGASSMVLRLLGLVNLTASQSFRVFGTVEEAAAAVAAP